MRAPLLASGTLLGVVLSWWALEGARERTAIPEAISPALQLTGEDRTAPVPGPFGSTGSQRGPGRQGSLSPLELGNAGTTGIDDASVGSPDRGSAPSMGLPQSAGSAAPLGLRRWMADRSSAFPEGSDLLPEHREMMARLRAPRPARPVPPPNDGGDEGGGAAPAGLDPPPAICFAPGTDRALIDAINQAAWEGFHRSAGDDAFAVAAFQLSNRWSRTALTSAGGGRFSSLDRGDPVTLTWGFIPDGTTIPGGSQGSGEPSGPSDLIAWMNGWYGSNPDSTRPEDQPWFPIFESVFEQWSRLAGVRYVYEPNDDGASFPSSDGRWGVRPDIRIGGHRIDGTGNTLAYNFFPDRGDMVIDTDDGYLESRTSDALRLRNVVAHEHGHGLGLQHVCPIDSTKLMEPRITTNFDGPQFDDIYSANRLYGDTLEDTDDNPDSDRNDSAATAADLGTLAFGTTRFDPLSIDDDSDSDFLAFRLPAADARLGVLVRPIGGTYREGAQSSDGSCPTGTLFDAAIVHDLRFDILAGNGTTVIASIDDHPAGEAEAVDRLALPDGAGPYFLRIRGGNADNAQLYALELTVEPDSLPVATLAAIEVAEGAGTATFTIALDRDAVVPATVDYALVGDSAVAGEDFVAATGTLEIPAGAAHAEVAATILDDARNENDERFFLTLTNPSLVILGNVSATATILDDDPEPAITLQPIDTQESNGTLLLLARLSAASGKPVSVPYDVVSESAEAGIDFIATNGTLEFTPGTTSAFRPITLIDDDLDEDDETVRVVFGTPVNAASAEGGLLVILDDDPMPGLTFEGEADAGETGGRLVFTARLDSPSGRDVVVDWIADGPDVDPGSDFTPAAGTLVIPAGETEGAVILTVIDDDHPERNEHVTLSIVGDPNAVVASPSASLAILDEDAGRLLDETVRLEFTTGEGADLSAVVRWDAVPGRPYRILGSADFHSWAVLFAEDIVPETADAAAPLPPIEPGEPERRFIRVLDPGRPEDPEGN